MKTIIEMAREAGKDISPDHGLVDFLKRLESIVRSDERKLIYDLVMFAPFKDDADLLMPESEVNPDEADDFFKVPNSDMP